MDLQRRTVILGATAYAGVGLQPWSVDAADLDEAPGARNDGWPVDRPSEAGFEPAALEALTKRIRVGEFANVHAVLVEHGGKLVFERYFTGQDESWGTSLGEIKHGPDTLHDLRSVTKSVTSALLGIALGADHEAAVVQPIADFFPDLADKIGKGAAGVTLHHVLTMTAGLRWNEMEVHYTDSSNDEIRLYYTDDPVGMVLTRPVVQTPGASWYYNGGLTQVVAGLIERRIGKPIDKFAEGVLFGPLGITDYHWLRSAAWPQGASPSAASGLRLSARDLAKIASLFIHGGAWHGRQIIPTDWITRSTERHVQDIPWGPPGVYGYGYFWYPGEFKEWGNLRVIRAVGNGDQRLFIAPDQRTAVTIFAGNYNDFQHASGDRIFGAVMAARTEW